MRTLQYRGTGKDYGDESYPEVLETIGCGCCSGKVPLTRANLQEAIDDAREWLEYLESLDPID